MKKGTKILIYIILLLCICAFGSTYYFLYVRKENKVLSGEKLTDGIYVYPFETDEFNHGTIVYKDGIYYWQEKNKVYDFYNIDIYTNEKKQIGQISSEDYYCYLENDYIDCSNDAGRYIFNYKFEKIYEGNDKAVVPYKKDLLKIEKDTVYYKNKEYKKLERDFTNLIYYRHDSFDDNVYMFFIGDNEDDCILNVEEGKCESYKYRNIIQYSKGFYFFDENTINVLDIKTKEIKKYDNPVKDELLTLSQVDDTKLYYFSDDCIKVYNLETGKFSYLDYKIKNPIDSLFLSGNLLYLVSTDRVFVINLDEIVLSKEMTNKEFEELEVKLIDERIENIKNKFNVVIKIRKDADLKFTSTRETITGEQDNEKINDSLDAIEELFSIFGKEVFDEFYHDTYKGLNVYLASDIEASMDMNGEEFIYYDNYAIITRTTDVRRTMCHEMMHALEDAVLTKKKPIFEKWFSYNPKKFEYGIKSKYYGRYTVGSEKDDVYFVDSYSQTNDFEDKARIFENMCMNTTENIKKNPKLLNKAKYLRDELIKYYPTLKDSSIMNSLD